MQYSSESEFAVCNLASIGLPSFVCRDKQFDFDALHKAVKVVVVNLNIIMDSNFYPVPEAKTSNERHRAIGVGVQGLADTFILMGFPYGSKESKDLNIAIFETMYHAALESSNELASVDGSYPTWYGSPASMGLLQYDLWGIEPSDRFDWGSLKRKITLTGLRNSMFIAPMPTAGTSQIFGFSECFDANIK